MQYTFLSSRLLAFSIAIAVLVSLASVLGLLHTAVYEQETANWALQARGQDIGNLIAVPILVLSILFNFKKNIFSFPVWLGSMFYFIYAYLVYSFAVHFNYLFLVYVAILGISIYSVLVAVIANRKMLTMPQKFSQTKFSSIVLIGTGSLFMLLWLSEILPALLNNGAPESLALTGLWVNPIHVIDLSIVLPGMIIVGVSLWQKKTLGYILGAPWLIFSILMGTSIIATLIMELQQGTTAATPPLVMVSTVVLLSLIASVQLLRSAKQ